MASPSAVAASGLFLMENRLALDIPETLEIYEETTQGPQQKSSANLRAMSKDLIWMHITQEEYHHLPGVLEHHPQDLEGHLGVKKITQIPSNLRHPWRHISLSQHPLQAITSTSWLISEGRLYTATVEQSHLICFKPSTWNLASAFKDELINSWSRHEVGNHLQVIHQAYTLHHLPSRGTSSRTSLVHSLGVKDIFGAITSHTVHRAWQHLRPSSSSRRPSRTQRIMLVFTSWKDCHLRHLKVS